MTKLSGRAKEGLSDLFAFGTYFLGLQLAEKPHREMCEVLQSTLSSETPYSMLVVPRGLYKTSLCKAFAIQTLLRELHLNGNPFFRIVYASATLGLGKMFLASVEGIMRAGGLNGRIDEEYGRLWKNRDQKYPSSKVEEGINIAPRIMEGERAYGPEPNIFIGSARRISTGFHADMAVVDDLNNRENTKTPHQRAEIHAYWNLLFPILGSKREDGSRARIVMPCTPWHDDDVRGKILRDEEQKRLKNPDYKSQWSIVHRSAINPDGTPYAPGLLPLDELERLKTDLPYYIYSANYECDPVGREGAFVEEAKIHFEDRKSFPGFVTGRITIDPSQHKEAKESGCYSAITVCAFDRWAKMYVLDARGSREWDGKDLLREMFAVQEDYPQFQMWIEDSHMSYFETAIRSEEARLSADAGHPVRLRVNWLPIDYKTTKYERWDRLAIRFRSDSVTFADSIDPKLKAELRDELVRGRAARFQDFLDALAMAETGVRPRVLRSGELAEVIADPMKGEKREAPKGFSWMDAFATRRRRR